MFSVATIFLVAFALNLRDAVYGSVAVSTVVTSSSSSSSSSSTTPASYSVSMTTASSPTQTLSAIVSSSAAAASTSGTSSETTSKTSSETPSATGTTSPSSVTTEKPTPTPSSEKTCASVSATSKDPIPEENVTQILHHSFFSESKYREPNITNLKTDGKKITFLVCVKVVFDGEVESDFESQARELLNATGVTIEIIGVDITGWKAVDGACGKCSGGGGGPIQIQGRCKPKTERYSCKGVKESMETTDCSTYCSGVASFMVSYLLVSMGIALSLSFYL